MKPRKLIWFIILLTFFAAFVDLPKSLPLHIKTPFRDIRVELKRPDFDLRIAGIRLVRDLEPRLGLDLQGGAHLVFEADTSGIADADKDSALESTKAIIEKRINLFGATEPVIQSAKVGDSRRIIVEIPGVTDINQAINLIGQTAQLTFWETASDAASPSAEATASAFGPFTKKTDLSGKDLRRAQVTFDQNTSEPQVTLDFTSDGGSKFADITKRNIEKQVAIALDNQIISAPVVRQEITGGSAVISGGFTVDQAKELSIQLNAGALPLPIKIIEQRNVGATLGSESIQKSLLAGAIGITIVMIFMVVYYGFPGILAAIALIIYTLLTFALFKLIPITLTLAGIAGFILSIGMAVDANILIFERMKEEMRWGKKRVAAIEAGFARAWTSIRDSNISSLITSAILYYFGTGLVRGFALTLALGILISMFSAIVVTRTFLRLVYRN